MMLLLKVFTVCSCLRSLNSLSQKDNLRWVPPRQHDWRNTDIPQNVKVYWENRWAKASFQKGCSEEGSLQITPVYYWPGDRVDLPCKMCQMAYLMNGRMKRWGYSNNIDEFLLNPKQFVRVNELWEDVQNTESFDKDEEDKMDENDVIYYPQIPLDPKDIKNTTKRDKKPPRFWQNDGKLTIFSTDVRAQGVYFCYDEFSRKQTVLFYVLIAMLPPASSTTKNPTVFTDHCGHEKGIDGSKIFPSHNWRYHFLPMGDFSPPQTCQLDETDTEQCVETFQYLNKTLWPKNLDDECSMNRCRARLVSPEDNIDLFIELRWDAWTSCAGDQPTKRREAHCYLVRGEGSINIESMAAKDKKNYAWIRHLETVFDRKPFDVQGVRLHSSLITSAIFDKEKITGCYNKKDEEEESYLKYDQVWRRVFLPTLGVPEKGEVFQLLNPFEACIRFARIENEEDDEMITVENLIGTYATQVDYC